ncbi:hypothetical protein TSUD_238610 [Trifolium subterraneum]|uniref:Uncharacterized protein n=1 Tax=Trifolium subterraneum TaxID=3900 RepID=A0A2Z6PDV1_TRISU|nr:hypothetical protein TSUD_238610 [Trifolium subterraneum]
MAEAVIEVVLNNLSSLIQKELGLFLGVDRELNSLSSLLTTIKATLEDAEEKQFSNRAIKDWLHKLKNAAHILDDILDECATQALEYGGNKGRLSNKVTNSFLSSFHPKHVTFRFKIAKKMKSIRERLDEIAEERSKFHLTEIVREKKSGVSDWRQTTSIISQPQVYGRDEDRDKIVDIFVGDASSFEDLTVYPIVGLGGLGKTTLAQLIFNHDRIVNHFELRIWVCVSEDFSLKRMIKSIIESNSGQATADLELEPLQRRLVDLLQRKRYLLVLDDVWDDEQGNWKRLKSILACGGKGASILVTTRLPKVAAIMGTTPSHDLSMLCDTDCWKMFKERAFGTNEDEQTELVVIGKKIVKKCGGVPLAAIALGSLLRFKREENEWLYVLENELWTLQGENSVRPALRLSYLNLPVKLRQCFAFCALFPKGEMINKQFIIELWMANGFISSNGMLDAEDIGNEGEFQILPESLCNLWNLQIINLDYCQYLQKLPNNLVCLKALIRLSLRGCRSLSSLPPHIGKMNSLRTLSMYVVGKEKGLLLAELQQLNLKGDLYIKHLERVKSVMDAKEANMSSKHLNKLLFSWERNEESLSQENTEEILEALQPLTQQLQSLGVRGYAGEHFPQWMSTPSLKYLNSLELVDCKSCLHLPELGKLPSLKKLTISNMIHITYVDKNSNDNGVMGCFTTLEFLLLEKLPNLKKLSWKDSENMFPRLSTLQITKCPKLSGFPCLPSLNDMHIRGQCTQSLLSSIHKHHSLESIRFSDNEELTYFPYGMLRNLTSLKILDIFELFKLEQIPNEIVNLNAIQEIYISGCMSLTSIPDEVLQGLHSLKTLDIVRCPKFILSGSFQYLTCVEKLMIEGCSEIEGLHEALQHMTSLQSLILCDLPNLASLPDWLGNLGLLHELIISKCPKLRYFPMSIQCLTCLKSLRIYGCTELGKRCKKETGEDWRKIAHVQDIEIQNWVVHIVRRGNGTYSSANLF